jgi:hypothetical protein
MLLLLIESSTPTSGSSISYYSGTQDTDNRAFNKIIACRRGNMLRQPKNNQLLTISMPSSGPMGQLSSGITHASRRAANWTYWGRDTL